MKAIILAAGYGTRLGSLTKNAAKPLLSVAGKTIVGHILDKLLEIPLLSQVYVVTNQKFYGDFKEWEASRTFPLPLKIINDGTTCNDDRLGSIGDINFVIEKEKIDDDLIIIGGDNLFEDKLDHFISFFQKNGSTIFLHDVKSLSLARMLGIASVDRDSKINSFIEKPEQPPSTLAATLIYALKKDHVKYIKMALAEGKADRAGDFIKFLSERQPVFGISLRGRWFDIGTPEALRDAGEFFTR